MSEVKVPEGYKQTEVGVIPEDWEVVSLGDAVEFLDGQRRPIKYSERTKISGIYPYYGASGIVDHVNDYIFDEELILLGEDGENILSRNLPLAFKVTGKIWVNNHAHVMRPNDNFNITFLTDFLESLDYSLLNSGSAQPKLNKASCLKIKVVKPSKQEQTAIATALSDVDNLIGSLEKLIAKKEAIKTGMMQQLLTGKTRLPEFATREDGNPKGFKQTELGRIPEDWEHKTLFEMTENKGLVRGPFGGALKKDSFVRTGFKVYEQRNAIYANTEIGKYYIDRDKFNELQRFTVKPKDFIVSCSGTIGKIYQIPVNAPEGIINQALLKITLSKNTDERFFYQIFNSKEFQESITDSTQGGAMKNLIGMSEFKKSIMLMPPKTEQTAIATILADMDAEIQALQQRLEKTRDIKQGMMQQLLTGKVRLVD